jgi:hypothetical protein
MKSVLRLLPLALVASGLLATPGAAQTPAVELKVGDQGQDLQPEQGPPGSVGCARLVPEGVHCWLNGRM